MPLVRVNTSIVQNVIKNKDNVNAQIGESDKNDRCIVSTPLGLSILEIQGELNLPSRIPDDKDNCDVAYLQNFVTVDEIYEAVKFGRLVIEGESSAKATLFIGSSQRLLGKIVDLDPPLAVLKIPRKGELTNVSGNQERSDEIDMIDIIRKKIIFQERPLPIM